MMDEANWVIPTSILLLLFFLFLYSILSFTLNKHRHLNKKHQKNLPPSPPSLPFIGHLHLIIKQPLHRSLHNLTQKYGHTLFLQLGTRKVLVISSPSAIEECFTKNDVTFANRPYTLAAKHLNYNQKTVGFAPYGDHWRNLRRLMALELFSNNRIAMFTKVREEEVQLLVKQIYEECNREKKVSSKVDLKMRLVEFSFNIMLRMISGKRYYGKHAVAEGGKEFRILMREFTELEGNANLNDFFPLLQWIDFQGLEKRMGELMKKLDRFFQNLLDEHRMRNSMSSNNNVAGNDHNQMSMTLIDVMLHLRETEPEFYTDENIKGVILIMLIAGSESSAIAMEWALSLLLNHPEAMNKVMDEINTMVGEEQLMNESDLVSLNYLQNVITETLRLYPVAPQLLPHESSSDCQVGGFDIPKGTMLLVNLWTLHRNSELWKDPTMFVPERFEGIRRECDVYNMIPFGIGRRACPGSVLAKRVMVHALGALIQCFELERIRHDEEINMEEGLGLTMPKLEPLVAFCRPRPSMIKALSNICNFCE